MTMIEKMARAMLEDEVGNAAVGATWEDEGPIWIKNARAALTALLDPSEGMVEAGKHGVINPAWLSSTFTKMIQHALDEGVREDG